MPSKRKRRTAFWNMRSVGICGKLENLKLQMKRYNIVVLCISEIKWLDQGDFWSEDFRVMFSGYDNKIAGIGIIVSKDVGKKFSLIQYNSRIIAIKLDTKPVNTFIIFIMLTSRNV